MSRSSRSFCTPENRNSTGRDQRLAYALLLWLFSPRSRPADGTYLRQSNRATQLLSESQVHAEQTWNPPSRKGSGATGKKNTETKAFKVPLTIPETIYKVTRTRRHGEMQSRRRTILEAGEDNGVMELSGKVYG